MKVNDVMKTEVGFCSPEDSLMKAADIMRSRDCGAVPIVDENKRAIGILTDRDLCLAVVARNRKASDVKTVELINGKLIVCAAEDKLGDALRKMRKYRIKHLVAVGSEGELIGILPLSDVLLSVGKDKDLKKTFYSTLKAIYKPQPIVLREIESEN